MGYVTWKVERTPFIDNEWNTLQTEVLSTARDLNLIQELGDGKDKFSFNITNVHGELDNYFQPNDKITIYRAVNKDTVDASEVLMVGTIKDTPDVKSSSKSQKKVEGFNFSESLMDAIVFFEAVNSTPAEIIQQALGNAAAKNTNFTVEWHPDNNTAIAGLTYPRYTERFFNKTLREVIEKYSTKPKVGNNNSSYYYVDKDNRLVWRPKTNTISYSFNSETEQFKQLKIGRDIKGVRNYIILKGGQDSSGTQIQTRYVDYSSVSKYGTKYKFLVSENNTAKNLIDLDIKKTYGKDFSPDGYPNITTSAFTTAWRSQSPETYTTNKYSIEVIPGNYVTINQGTVDANKEAYNEVIREEIKRALRAEGEEFTRNRRFGKIEVELEFSAGKKNWILGDYIECNIPELRDETQSLRVTDIQYTTDTDTFTLIEDEGSL